jgi:hypothetical protein
MSLSHYAPGANPSSATLTPGTLAQTQFEVGNHYVLQETLSAYADEAYTNAKKLTGTAIVGTNPMIDPNTETFAGQIRWTKPLNPKINIASLTDPTRGDVTYYGQNYLEYIKSVRTHGTDKVNLREMVTQVDGLAKVGRDFGETRSQDEHNGLLSVCKGVAISEALYGAGTASGEAGVGGQTFENDPVSKKNGFYVDLGNTSVITSATPGNIGAQRATGFLDAFGMAFKDYEPEYAYLLTSPEVFASLRSANLVDSDRVTEGQVQFNTIFQGKFRLIQTRASQSMLPAEFTKLAGAGGFPIVGTKTSFIILPGSIAMAPLSVPTPTEIGRHPGMYKGGGMTEIWYRWGYVMAPAGYSWKGSKEQFASDADYKAVIEDGTPKALTAATNGLVDTVGVWERKFQSVLSLGILPIFHG